MNQLEKLKKYTKVVADTGDFESIAKYKPEDATTNPTLIYKSSQDEKYLHLIQKSIKKAKKISSTDILENALDEIFVNFGIEILKIIPGRVSIEVDARLSFDKENSIKHILHNPNFL